VDCYRRGASSAWLSAGGSFPALRAPVFVEVDTVPDTAGVSCQEFIVPYLVSEGEFLEPLRIAESSDQIVLCDLADAGFKFFDSWFVTARQKKGQEET
jgi:hypothetical protein